MLKLDELIISQSLNQEKEVYLSMKSSQLEKLLNISSNDNAVSVIHQIYKYYNQSHRHYHNLSHIYNLFKLNDGLKSDYHHLIEVTIWFHDVIYQPFYKNNEARSNAFFMKTLSKETSHQLQKDEIEWISAAIMSTFGHQPRMEGERSIELFLDIDLSILATDWTMYQKYTESIRKEYWIYPDSLYKRGRSKVLKHFLGRECIFYTDFFKEKEAIARQNLVREIEVLSK